MPELIPSPDFVLGRGHCRLVRWLVLGVVMYTAFMLLRAARSEET